MMRPAVVVAVVIVLALMPDIGTADEPFYGFFPSELGAQHKQLRHNILGFRIDMPANWTFGVNGQPPLAVALLYPDGLDTSKLTRNYETIELGTLLQHEVSLDRAYEQTMLGMRAAHPNLELVKGPDGDTKAGGRKTIDFMFSWRSRAGIEVIEWVTLVSDDARVRSVTVRASGERFAARRTFYESIVRTYQPTEPTSGLARE